MIFLYILSNVFVNFKNSELKNTIPNRPLGFRLEVCLRSVTKLIQYLCLFCFINHFMPSYWVDWITCWTHLLPFVSTSALLFLFWVYYWVSYLFWVFWSCILFPIWLKKKNLLFKVSGKAIPLYGMLIWHWKFEK